MASKFGGVPVTQSKFGGVPVAPTTQAVVPPAPKPQPSFSQLLGKYRAGQMTLVSEEAFEKLLARKMPRMFHDKAFTAEGETLGSSRPLLDRAANAASNFPDSAMKVGEGLVDMVMNPVDTATALAKTGGAALQALNPGETGTAEDEQIWDGVSESLVKNYGSAENFAKYAEEDPAAAMLDVAGLLTLGGGSLAKIPGMTKAAKVLTSVGESLDLVQVAGKTAAAIGKPLAAGGSRITEELVGMATGVGRPTAAAAKAGTRSLFDTINETYKGKKPRNKGFDKGRQGKVSMVDLANSAKVAITDVVEQRKQLFRENLDTLETSDVDIVMDDVTGVLIDSMEDLNVDFVQEATKGAKGRKGSSVADTLDYSRVLPGTENQVKKIMERVLRHGERAEDLTPAGMLDLREYLGSITTKSRRVRETVDNLRTSIDDTLAEIPGYDKLRKDADTYDGLIKGFEETLGLTADASGQEIIKKLLSAGVDDVDIRRSMIKQLEELTDSSLSQEIAGMEMQGILPKALITRAMGAGVVYGVGGSWPALALIAAAASPRLMGKLLSQYGYSRNTIRKVVDNLKKRGAFEQKTTTSAAIASRVAREESDPTNDSSQITR